MLILKKSGRSFSKTRYGEPSKPRGRALARAGWQRLKPREQLSLKERKQRETHPMPTRSTTSLSSTATGTTSMAFEQINSKNS